MPHGQDAPSEFFEPGQSLSAQDETLQRVLGEVKKIYEAEAARWKTPWLTVEAAATYSSLSACSIRRMIYEGRLNPFRPVGGKILISREELDRSIRNSSKRRSTRGKGKR